MRVSAEELGDTHNRRYLPYFVSSFKNGTVLMEPTESRDIFPRSFTASFLINDGRQRQQKGVMLAALV